MKQATLFLTESLNYKEIVFSIPKNIVNSNVLYRAFSGGYKTLKELGIHDVRKNRNPVDTPLEIHLMTDEAFFKKFNLKPRSESLFCSKSLKVAENYADSVEDVYIIIPKETNIKYVYSTKIRDFFDLMADSSFTLTCKEWGFVPKEGSNLTLKKLSKNKKAFEKCLPDIQELINKVVDSYEVTTSLDQVPSVGEVMVLCDSYYYINLMNINDEVEKYKDLLKLNLD